VKKNRFDGELGKSALGFDPSIRSYFEMKVEELRSLTNESITMK